MSRRLLALVALVSILAACAPPTERAALDTGAPRPDWAIAIHAGAGTIARDTYAPVREEYLEALRGAVRMGADALDAGESGVEVVERVVRHLEDDPRFNAGKGAVFNFEGGHELDAAIMDGSDRSCGAVAGVTTVRHPITLARNVMERTGHVLLAGAGAERLADEVGVERVDNSWFGTEARRESWERFREQRDAAEVHGTVGVVVLDRDGHLAAGTSTGGITGKRYGRIGDSPVIGAGTYADDRTCAVSCTGKGEEFIRHGVARRVAHLMEMRGLGLGEAADQVVHGVLEPGTGGLVAVGHDGEIALVFNTPGMFRGAADSTGRFEVAIWE